jgi:hypothetical protein
LVKEPHLLPTLDVVGLRSSTGVKNHGILKKNYLRAPEGGIMASPERAGLAQN